MDIVLDVLSWASILAGLFFMLVGTLGVLRFPDVFTRLHAAGMTDTAGAGFLILGMCFHTVQVRLVLIYLFMLLTSPISGHALARAGLAGGVEPWTGESGGDA